MALSPKLQATGEALSDHIDEILTLFKPGALVTIVVRFPDTGEKDLVIGNDTSLEGPIEALERCKERANIGAVH